MSELSKRRAKILYIDGDGMFEVEIGGMSQEDVDLMDELHEAGVSKDLRARVAVKLSSLALYEDGKGDQVSPRCWWVRPDPEPPGYEREDETDE